MLCYQNALKWVHVLSKDTGFNMFNQGAKGICFNDWLNPDPKVTNNKV